MTLDELIAELEEIRDAKDGDLDVRVAQQPNWPLRNALQCVKVHEGKLWLVASGTAPYDENPYCSKRLWDEGEFDLDRVECAECGREATTQDEDELDDAGWCSVDDDWACPSCFKELAGEGAV
jgi:hypothetical protein